MLNLWGISFAILARDFAHQRNNAQAHCGSWYLHERLGEPQPLLT
jgi:hypothetical protein